jgi:hypothetical protein
MVQPADWIIFSTARQYCAMPRCCRSIKSDQQMLAFQHGETFLFP